MSEKYDHQVIEKKWQKRWAEDKVFSVDNNFDHPGASRHPSSDGRRGSAEYVLDMFPYPSGDGLHVGHPEGYTATDIYSRYLRMNEKKVLHPMGWDAFGLPAENYAIKMGVHPAEVTNKNIANFKRQIQSLGFSYDWSREINTTDPKYYKWTQWIFLQLFKKGLAYEKEAPIWWCPKDKTGLANEEVVNGKCDRCGTAVEKKMLKQWMLKITAYADRLLEGLEKVDWPESIKALQRNWIGRSEGAEVDFTIAQSRSTAKKKILVGTRNAAKVGMIKQAFAKLEDIEIISLNDLPDIDDSSLVEIDDYLENAKRKSAFYFQKTGIPSISTDHILWIAKWPENNGVIVHIRKLANPNSSRATDEEVIAWYQKFLAGVGGSSLARFDYAMAYTDGQGTSVYASPQREYILQTERASEFPEGYPTEPLLKDPVTDEFRVDQDTEIPYQNAFALLRTTIHDRICQLPKETIRVFTTRPDTLFGATYLVLSPEHELVSQITTKEQKKAVEKYVKSLTGKSDLERTSLEKEKTGVFTGAYAINPVNQEKIPVWIADYVLSSYGTGAIMAVPAHDERDFAFAKKHKLPIIKVIKPPSVMPTNPMEIAVGSTGMGHRTSDIESECWVGEGVLINSGHFTDLASEAARKKIVEMLEEQKCGRLSVNYKLRDWVFSRQRYWGEPIPLVHCENCVDVVESTPHYLNFYRPEIWENIKSGTKTIETRALNPDEPERFFGKIKAEDYIKAIFKPTGEIMWLRVKQVKKYISLKEVFEDKELLMKMLPGKKHESVEALTKDYNALAEGYADRINNHGMVAFEIKPVIPGIIPLKQHELPLELPSVENYQPSGTGKSPLSQVDDWVNVTCRVCGHLAKRETNTMPQWAGSCWYYLRYCDPNNDQEFASAEAMKSWLPVDMYVGGAEHAVLHLLYSRFWHKVLFDMGHIPEEVGDEPFMKLKNQGLILGPDGEKMSKSRGNVINPDEIVEKFGADTLRMYEMFMGPFEDAKPWDTNGILGVKRFLDRVWTLKDKVDHDEVGRSSASHRYAASISKGIPNFQLNTCVSDLMKWSNEWKSTPSVPQGDVEVFLKLLSPFAPHIAEELWQQIGHETLLSQEKWPGFDEDQLQDDTVTITVQVNGKLRGTLSMSTGSGQDVVVDAAKSNENVKKFLTGEPKKIIFVKDKLVNFVISL